METDKNAKDKLINFIKVCNDLLGIKLLPFLTAIIPIMICLYSFHHSMKCQSTYNIPSKYFSLTMNDIMPYGIIITLIIFAILYNYFFYKKINKGDKIIDKTFIVWAL